MILTIEEYKNMGFEGGEDESACEKALTRAENLVALLCGGSLESFDESAVPCLKQAIAAQAEEYLLNGGQPMSGKTTVGDFSYSAEENGGTAVSPLAMTVLKLGGLYCCAVEGRR